MSYRIAIASSSGDTVDQHFGHAPNLLIYEIGEEGATFIEDRALNRNASEPPHSDTNLATTIRQLSDCSALFVVKIGMHISRHLYENGLKTFQLTTPINQLLTRLADNYRKGRVKVL